MYVIDEKEISKDKIFIESLLLLIKGRAFNEKSSILLTNNFVEKNRTGNFKISY